MTIIQVIAAEGEHKASRSLRLAAEVIADSPAALQVEKYTGYQIGKYKKINPPPALQVRSTTLYFLTELALNF